MDFSKALQETTTSLGKRKLISKSGTRCLMKIRNNAYRSYGIKPDVTIINYVFRQDYRKWLSLT